MTEQKNQLASLFAACWKDEALKARFMFDPKAVLAEYDMDVPDGMDVKVVENADNCVHITMPTPPSGHMKLSDEQLSNAAGGAGSIQALIPQDPMFDFRLAENGMTRKQVNDALQSWC
jgi:hypothetical protein